MDVLLQDQTATLKEVEKVKEQLDILMNTAIFIQFMALVLQLMVVVAVVGTILEVVVDLILEMEHTTEEVFRTQPTIQHGIQNILALPTQQVLEGEEVDIHFQNQIKMQMLLDQTMLLGVEMQENQMVDLEDTL